MEQDYINGAWLNGASTSANMNPSKRSDICTILLKYATHFERHAKAGMVMVNAPTTGVDYRVPFGSRRSSSYGAREQGTYAAEFFPTAKTAYCGV